MEEAVVFTDQQGVLYPVTPTETEQREDPIYLTVCSHKTGELMELD